MRQLKVIFEISEKRLGVTVVVDAERVVGLSQMET
jgi:hypothetical protein